MRKDRNFGILLSTAFFVAGTFLLYESITHSEWYMDIFLFAGATISGTGLITMCWAIGRHRSISRLELHVRGHK